MRICCVTAITADKDTLKTPPPTKGIDYICYTDNPSLKSDVWDIRLACSKYKDPHYNSRRHKILIHEYVDHDINVWIDGMIQLTVPLTEMIEMAGGAEMAGIKHPRSSWYEEALVLQRRRKDDPGKIQQQIDRYDGLRFSRSVGVFCGAFLIRRNTERVMRFNRLWWGEILNYSRRDQISLPFAAAQAGLEIKNLMGWKTQTRQNRLHHEPHNWQTKPEAGIIYG